jgi:RNA polymerase sigma-70 factor, ECF subfamily
MAMNSNALQFQQIYEEYQARILRYLSGMVGEGNAEDLTQDVFVKVALGLENFRGDSQLLTWIYRIATNTAIDWLRRSSTRRENTGNCPDEVPAEADETASAPAPVHIIEGEQRVIRKQMNGCIRSVIDTLPETYRTVIILSELEEIPDSGIADILGISLQAAKIRLHRARARLKKELDKACVFYRDERNEFACDRK